MTTPSSEAPVADAATADADFRPDVAVFILRAQPKPGCCEDAWKKQGRERDVSYHTRCILTTEK